jgi:methylenetetrahydrofolate reductase (NADPH)
VENPFAAPQQYRAERVGKKIAAGAQFIQTQLVFDVGIFERWMAQVRDLGLHERCYFLAGVGAITSMGALEFMRHLPGLVVPDDVVRRLKSVPEERLAAEGLDLCAETIQRLGEIPGVSGVHLSASRWEELVPQVLGRAGLEPHTASPGGESGGAPSAHLTEPISQASSSRSGGMS